MSGRSCIRGSMSTTPVRSAGSSGRGQRCCSPGRPLSAVSRPACGRSPRRAGRSEEPIHVAVASDRARLPPPGVRLHRMTQLESRVQWNTSPPRLRYEEAALDVAMSAATEFEAIAVLADAVQGRRTTARRLRTALADRPRASRRRWLDRVLADVAEGTCSVLEHGYLNRVERPHGLPRAVRQRPAGASRMAYRDAEYDGGLIVELDGRLFHDSARARDRDMDRDLEAAVDGRDSIRISWGQVFDRGCLTAGRLGRLLQKRGWRGAAVPCGPHCPLRVGSKSPGDSDPTRLG